MVAAKRGGDGVVTSSAFAARFKPRVSTFCCFFFILFDFLFFNEFFFVPSLFVGNECTDYIDFPKKKSSGLKIAFFFCFYFPADRF